jgi:predicted dehydrogenase
VRLRAAIVGCGRIGCAFDDDPKRGYVSTHAGAYSATPETPLVALADLDESRLKKYGAKFGVSALYRDYREMLRAERPDVLSVCTWNDTHLEIIEAAVEAGVRGIFCEKPLADTLEAADRIVELCERRGVVLLVDHVRRFDPFHQEIAAFIQGGHLGRIQQVTAYYTAGLANTGSHLVDLLRLYVGEAAWVQGLPSAAPAPNPNDPNIDGWIWFEKGFGAALQACDVHSYLILEVSVLGTEGRLRVTSSGFDVQFERVRDSARFSGYRELEPAGSPIDTNRPHEFMLEGVRHLVACVRGASPISSGRDGRRALELICGLRESAAADGQRVTLPLGSSRVTIQSL